jgi:hypothetical protein
MAKERTNTEHLVRAEENVYRMEVPIDGVPELVELRDVPIDDILLDEENPRIGYWHDNIARYVESTNQKDLELAIRAGGIEEYNRLKRSIEAGGGATELIWLMRRGDGYVCIDGNTRVMIYRDLRDKYAKKECFKKIKARILPEGTDERARNFIRLIAHLRAQNDWQAYERARMLYILWEKKGYTIEELLNTTKLKLNDIKRWILAYKMMNDQFLPVYGSKPEALMKFSYFVEYESKRIKDGMKRHSLEDKDFCDWVGNDEITRAQDVRDLKNIFDNERASEILVEEGFQAAREELRVSVPAYGSRLFEHIEKCIEGLRSMPREEERSIITGEEPKKKEDIRLLHKELSGLMDLIEKFDKG